MVRSALVVVCLAMVAFQTSAKVTVSDADLGFSFELPVGFAAASGERAAPPGVAPGDVVAYYVRGVGRLPATTVTVVRLHRPLAVPAAAEAARPSGGAADDGPVEAWKAFQLPVERTTEPGGTPRVTWSVQVPLTPEAVRIDVSGPANQEKRDRGLVKTILGSLTGPSTGDAPAVPAAPAKHAPAGRSPAAGSGSTPASAPPGASRVSSAEVRGEHFTTGILLLLAFVGVGAALLLRLFRQKAIASLGTPTAAGEPLPLTPARARLLGVVAVAGGALVCYWSVLQPLDDAARGAPSLSLTHSGVVIVPLLAGMGLILLVNGNHRWDVGRPKTAKVVGWIVLAVLFACGIALDVWFRSRLKSMGYAA